MNKVQAAGAACTAAWQTFLKSHERYEEAREDRVALKTHADQFIQDATRSRKLHEAARESKDLVDAFRREESWLFSNVALARAALQTRVSGHALRLINLQLEEAHASLDRLNAWLCSAGREGNRDLGFLDVRPLFEAAAVAELDAVERATRAAASVIELHLAEVRTFLHRHVDRSPEVIIEALREIVTKDVKGATIDLAWEVLTKAVPEVAAELEPMTRIARLFQRLQEEVLHLHPVYRRAGPEDAILDLPDHLAQPLRVCQAARQVVQTTFSGASA